MAGSIKLNSLKKAHPKVAISASETFLIGDKMFVTSTFLQTLFKIGKRQVTNLKNKGLTESNFSIKGLMLYDLAYTIAWYELNVNKEKANATAKTKDRAKNTTGTNAGTEAEQDGTEEEKGQKEIDYSDTHMDDLPWQEIERRVKLGQLKSITRKNEIEDGLYIPIENSDIAMAELAGMLISLLGNLRDIIPTEAEHQKRDHIVEILDFQFKDMIGELKQIVEKTTKESLAPTVYEILMLIIRKNNNGVCSTMITEAIERVPTIKELDAIKKDEPAKKEKVEKKKTAKKKASTKKEVQNKTNK